MNHSISEGLGSPCQTCPAFVSLHSIEFTIKALPLHQSAYLLAELYNFMVMASLYYSLKLFDEQIFILYALFLS